MKKVIILIFLSLLNSCEKFKVYDSCQDTNFTYELVNGKPDIQIITDQELDTVKLLFSLNNLKLDNYLVYKLNKDNLGMYDVGCFQYLKNLQLFSNEVIFHFDKLRHYNSLSGEIISGLSIDTTPESGVCQVINQFLVNIQKDNWFDRDRIAQTCFVCELGYFDINSGDGMASKNFKLAWKIKTATSDFPYAYFTDKDRNLIYFDNGIRY